MLKAEITNKEEIEKYLNDLPETSFRNARMIFAKAVLAAHSEIRGNTTNKLNVRTGALKQSIGQEVTGTELKSLRASVFSGSDGGLPIKYAPIHEYGGIIKAKKAYGSVPGGPYLNMPIADNLTPSGVPRMTARMVFSNGGYLRKSKRGNWVVLMDGKLMFLLLKKATIKPRLGMRDAADKQVPIILSDIQKIIGEG